MINKKQYEINIPYHYNASHKGAPYTLDGVKYFNGGELHEIVTKAVLGYNAEKDANTAFDKGSDIEELSASVKSGKATLTSAVLGNDYTSVKSVYFDRVHSSLWIYSVITDNIVTLYFMDKKAFSAFLDNFSYFDKTRKVIRIKDTSGKMIAWLDREVKTCQASHAVPTAGTGTGAM